MKLACVQIPGFNSEENRFKTLLGHLDVAEQQKAEVVVLPELFLDPYFCREEDQKFFSRAIHTNHPQIQKIIEWSGKTKIVVIIPFYEKRDAGLYHNSAIVTDGQGGTLGMYRKMHIPDDPGFYEKYYFTPGDLGYRVFTSPYGKIGVLICWDQWFPEAARLTAMQGCDLLVYPTAIGWDHTEATGDVFIKLKQEQLDAWITIQRSHAIANGVYVAAANRIGREEHLEFWGNSFVCGPDGKILEQASHHYEGLVIADCPLDKIEKQRQVWPFFRDRRVDSYAPLTQIFGSST